MQELGFNAMRTAELIATWEWVEPRKGEFDFGWFDRVFELSEKYQLQILLGTGVGNPPIWLLDLYSLLNADNASSKHCSQIYFPIFILFLILWTLINLPWAIAYLIDPLTLSLAWIVTVMLQTLGEPVYQIGNVVTSPVVNLEITPACTGLYQSVVLIAGILAWRSALNDGAPALVPDFRVEEVRKQHENDHWSPDPARAGPGQPPPSILGHIQPSAEAVDFSKAVWNALGYHGS